MLSQPPTVPGFALPLHRSLTEPVLISGAPRGWVIANGTIAAATGLGLRLWIAGLLIWVLGHAIAVALTRKDPAFLAVLSRHARHKGSLPC